MLEWLKIDMYYLSKEKKNKGIRGNMLIYFFWC